MTLDKKNESRNEIKTLVYSSHLMDRLEADILGYLFRWVPTRDLVVHVSQTCRRWHKVVKSHFPRLHEDLVFEPQRNIAQSLILSHKFDPDDFICSGCRYGPFDDGWKGKWFSMASTFQQSYDYCQNCFVNYVPQDERHQFAVYDPKEIMKHCNFNAGDDDHEEKGKDSENCSSSPGDMSVPTGVPEDRQGEAGLHGCMMVRTPFIVFGTFSADGDASWRDECFLCENSRVMAYKIPWEIESRVTERGSRLYTENLLNILYFRPPDFGSLQAWTLLGDELQPLVDESLVALTTLRKNKLPVPRSGWLVNCDSQSVYYGYVCHIIQSRFEPHRGLQAEHEEAHREAVFVRPAFRSVSEFLGEELSWRESSSKQEIQQKNSKSNQRQKGTPATVTKKGTSIAKRDTAFPDGSDSLVSGGVRSDLESLAYTIGLVQVPANPRERRRPKTGADTEEQLGAFDLEEYDQWARSCFIRNFSGAWWCRRASCFSLFSLKHRQPPRSEPLFFWLATTDGVYSDQFI